MSIHPIQMDLGVVVQVCVTARRESLGSAFQKAGLNIETFYNSDPFYWELLLNGVRSQQREALMRWMGMFIYEGFDIIGTSEVSMLESFKRRIPRVSYKEIVLALASDDI